MRWVHMAAVGCKFLHLRAAVNKAAQPCNLSQRVWCMPLLQSGCYSGVPHYVKWSKTSMKGRYVPETPLFLGQPLLHVLHACLRLSELVQTQVYVKLTQFRTTKNERTKACRSKFKHSYASKACRQLCNYMCSIQWPQTTHDFANSLQERYRSSLFDAKKTPSYLVLLYFTPSVDNGDNMYISKTDNVYRVPCATSPADLPVQLASPSPRPRMRG